ncbi:SDR family NAD(P)-dependent oxidoreductase [Actinomadura rugatobispora]|uniref:SDR family NAD(P)-dependent oxidoreductase n=1 Tax=Actinomadura rugatobispora TaxID=1994 RepID=A0ABW0ZWF5_9ACTN|nr:glucose 1-dehydrogenase [Actinomadura rugatobispora]
MRGLDGKVSLIAGAAPGNIGGATAHRLSSEGARVVVSDINEDAARALAEQIVAEGGDAVAIQVDLSSEQSVVGMMKFAVDSFGGVDHLFNVAADLSPATIGADSSHNVLDLPIEVWSRTIDVTLTGYMYTIRHAMPLMIERGGGSIVNTMSAAVWMAEPVRASYSAAKSGVEALTRHVARVGGRQGVRCNAVAPGTVLTEALLRTLPEEIQRRQLEEIPSTRLGKPEDIAAAVAFLFSDDGEWVNGQALSIDGGLIMR